VKNFINEARTFRLQHPHIMPLLDFGVSAENIPFFIMEYAPQGTLRLRYEKEGRFSPNVAAKYISQVASALQYAHNQRVIHRDIKPENMLLRANDTVLLSDFGIASVAHNSQSMSNDKKFSGTLHYMAPEQILGKPQPASDQYALGVVAYEWLCGRRPFQGTTIEVSMQHLSAFPPSFGSQGVALTPAIEGVVMRALAKEPRERFASVQEFSHAFEYACNLFSSFASPTYATESPAGLAALNTQVSSFQRSPGQYSPDPLIINMGISPAQNPPETDFSMRPPHTLPRTPAEMVQPRMLIAPPRRSPLLLLFLILCILTITSICILEYINVSASNQAFAQKKSSFTTSPVVNAIPTVTAVASQDTPTTMLQTIEAVHPDYQDSLTDATNSATIAANWDDTSAHGQKYPCDQTLVVRP
jgi:serine/threonine protein kinase